MQWQEFQCSLNTQVAIRDWKGWGRFWDHHKESGEEGRIAVTTHFLVLQPTTSSSGNWKYHFSHWSCCLLIISQWIWSILMLFILMFTNLSFWWSSLAWLSYNYANFLFAKGCGFYFFSPAIFEGSCYSQHVLYSNGFPNHKHKTKIWHFKI